VPLGIGLLTDDHSADPKDNFWKETCAKEVMYDVWEPWGGLSGPITTFKNGR